MNLRISKKEDPELNIAPLIDVVFLLLIFFMVTTTFEKERQLEINLPEANAEPVQAGRAIISVEVDKKGVIAVNKSILGKVGMEVIKESIRAELKGKKLPVRIVAHANTEHQAVVSVIDAVRRLGIKELSIETRR